MMPGMSPSQGKPPKELMSMLATLMLNSRLQQGRPGQNPVRSMQPASGGRMAELARMQLELNRPKQRLPVSEMPLVPQQQNYM